MASFLSQKEIIDFAKNILSVNNIGDYVEIFLRVLYPLFVLVGSDEIHSLPKSKYERQCTYCSTPCVHPLIKGKYKNQKVIFSKEMFLLLKKWFLNIIKKSGSSIEEKYHLFIKEWCQIYKNSKDDFTISSLGKRDTFDFTSTEPNKKRRKVIHSKGIFKLRYDSNDEIFNIECTKEVINCTNIISTNNRLYVIENAIYEINEDLCIKDNTIDYRMSNHGITGFCIINDKIYVSTSLDTIICLSNKTYMDSEYNNAIKTPCCLLPYIPGFLICNIDSISFVLIEDNRMILHKEPFCRIPSNEKVFWVDFTIDNNNLYIIDKSNNCIWISSLLQDKNNFTRFNYDFNSPSSICSLRLKNGKTLLVVADTRNKRILGFNINELYKEPIIIQEFDNCFPVKVVSLNNTLYGLTTNETSLPIVLPKVRPLPNYQHYSQYTCLSHPLWETKIEKQFLQDIQLEPTESSERANIFRKALYLTLHAPIHDILPIAANLMLKTRKYLLNLTFNDNEQELLERQKILLDVLLIFDNRLDNLPFYSDLGKLLPKGHYNGNKPKIGTIVVAKAIKDKKYQTYDMNFSNINTLDTLSVVSCKPSVVDKTLKKSILTDIIVSFWGQLFVRVKKPEDDSILDFDVLFVIADTSSNNGLGILISPFSLKQHQTKLIIGKCYKTKKCIYTRKEELPEELQNDWEDNIIYVVVERPPCTYLDIHQYFNNLGLFNKFSLHSVYNEERNILQ